MVLGTGLHISCKTRLTHSATTAGGDRASKRPCAYLIQRVTCQIWFVRVMGSFRDPSRGPEADANNIHATAVFWLLSAHLCFSLVCHNNLLHVVIVHLLSYYALPQNIISMSYMELLRSFRGYTVKLWSLADKTPQISRLRCQWWKFRQTYHGNVR